MQQPPVTALGSESKSESARQAAELAALRRMLDVSAGVFSLSFAVFNTRPLRQELLATLADTVPGIVMVTLPAQTTDPLQATQEQLGAGTMQALFVLDLENTLTTEGALQPCTLNALNASRELWEAFKCPVVFWLAEHAAALMSQQAVDFWRYHSHTFDFSAPTLASNTWQTEASFEEGMVSGLPYDEKKFRRAALVQRLAEVGDSPSNAMLPHVLVWLFELAELHQIFNDYAEAEKLYRDALQLSEQMYGVKTSESATALNNLAQLLQATNRLSEAEPLMQRVLAIDEQVSGAEHPSVARDLNNLAQLLKATNRLSEAEPLMRRALVIDEQVSGAEHPKVAIRLNNLAMLLKATNRLSEAEPLMRRALAINEQVYGAEHPNVARDLNNLATLLQATNRVSEAEPLMRRALAIDEQAYGADHPSVAIDLNNLAHLFEDTNRLSEAEPLMRRCVAIFLRFSVATGHQHPHWQAAQNNYTRLLKKQGLTDAQIQQRITTLTQTHGQQKHVED